MQTNQLLPADPKHNTCNSREFKCHNSVVVLKAHFKDGRPMPRDFPHLLVNATLVNAQKDRHQ